MSEFKTNRVPWWGSRRFARSLLDQVARLDRELTIEKAKTVRLAEIAQKLLADAKEIQRENEQIKSRMSELHLLSIVELEQKRADLIREADGLTKKIAADQFEIAHERELLQRQIDEAKKTIVETRETALLQEVGIYDYRHPLSDAVSYQSALKQLQDAIKTMAKKDGLAILSATNWTVNGSTSEGAKMLREVSKLMLRAFNAEADAIISDLKPYKRSSALARLKKTAETIERLGKTMSIRISPAYFQLRADEVDLTSDFLQKKAEEKEVERQERERMREERKAQAEIEREKAKLEKEKQHYTNALAALQAKDDPDGILRVQAQIDEVDKSIASMGFRAANIRAGYVYVISNIGSFGEQIIKVGMTRRLEPMERVRELSDASVPFNFDVHALFFSADAVGIETAMHERLAPRRVNAVNRRREFFRASPSEAKELLGDLAGELLQFNETPEALEYRQTLKIVAPSF
ncbi:MAG: DUF4041 domain-containing protein [Xanthobacteraceae bacterium]